MTSIHHNIITGDPALYAPDRAGRPNAFTHETVETCPFCPGNESMTPPDIARISNASAWTARVFPNKYPAAQHHEVIVESADHEKGFESIADAAAVLRLCLDRYRDVAERPGVEYVSLFKNSGAMAGASLEHTHSQLIGVPLVPPRLAREAAAFAAARYCPLCASGHEHPIRDSARFTWFAPPASIMPYEQWIAPKRHVSQPDDLRDEEIVELAGLLQSAASGMRRLSSSFNWSFVAFPMTAAGHFYVQLFPRMTSLAGFELATGMFIEIIDPAVTARVMG